MQTGGTIRSDSLYVRRPADDELPEALAAGEFCWVLAPRQIGKSSLMVRAIDRLRSEERRCVTLDLLIIGSQTSEESFYFGLLDEIASQLELGTDLETFWQKRSRSSPAGRWSRFFRQVLLEREKGQIVIFIDEVDAVLDLPFAADDFFDSIRGVYNRREVDQAFRRLTFCLLGVTAPSEVIRDRRRTPFNVGRVIRLEDFTPSEARALLPALADLSPDPEALLAAILEWTSGHPYMTQRICRALSEKVEGAGSAGERVRSVAEELFFGAPSDANLRSAQNELLRAGSAIPEMLALYERLLTGSDVKVDALDAVQRALILTGMVASRVVGGKALLRVRNRIYAATFDLEWAKQQAEAVAGGSAPEPEGETIPPPQPPGTDETDYWYVSRPGAEKRAAEFLSRHGSPVVLVGPERVGKSYFLNYLLETHWQPDEAKVQINIASLDAGAKTSLENMLLGIAFELVDQLGLGEDSVGKAWKSRRPAALKLTKFFERVVWPVVNGRLFLAIDHADVILDTGFASDLFGVFRRWSELGGRGGPWDRLRIILALSTEPALLETSIHSSPFNLTEPIRLGDFTVEQVREMAARHGLDWTAGDVRRLMNLVGGQPYLVRKVFYEAAVGGSTAGELLADPASLFGDHLRSMSLKVDADPALREAVDRVLEGEVGEVDIDASRRLRSLGLLEGERGSYHLRYRLYEQFFRDRSESSGEAGEPPAVEAGADFDPLTLAFRLVFGGFASPDLLLSLDPGRVAEAVREVPGDGKRPQAAAEVEANLERDQPGIAPNRLWLEWMRATRGESLEQVRRRLTV